MQQQKLKTYNKLACNLLSIVVHCTHENSSQPEHLKMPSQYAQLIQGNVQDSYHWLP